MTPKFLKQLNKTLDVIITVPVGHPAWPKEIFEPLFVFPFVRHDPWQLQGIPQMYALEWKLRGLWKAEAFMEGTSLLRQFCKQCEGWAP
jgi:hypothetical protein